MLKIGKKTKEWNALRRKLKTAFAEAGIFSCEIRLDSNCTGAWTAAFAHIDKRDKLAPEELESVVLACQSCHHKVEYFCEKYTNQTMREYLTHIINNRNVPVRSVLQ